MKLMLFVSAISLLLINNSLSAMVGGWSDVLDVNSEYIQKLISLASEKITNASNSLYIMRPIEVVNATKQLVAGMKYKFTLRMAATECKKNRSDHINLSECEPLKCGAIDRCNVVIWDKPWEENGTKVLEHSCERELKSC